MYNCTAPSTGRRHARCTYTCLNAATTTDKDAGHTHLLYMYGVCTSGQSFFLSDLYS